MALIRSRLDELGVAEPAWPHEVGFSNGAPLLAAFWTAGNNRYVGWQYQNCQWRLAMILGDVGGTARRMDRERLALEREEYFDFGRLQQALRTGNSPTQYANHGSLPFNAFEPAFLYRYRKVAPSTPVETIVELAVFYSRHAAEWGARRCWLPG
jgi:hypothetical protein